MNLLMKVILILLVLNVVVMNISTSNQFKEIKTSNYNFKKVADNIFNCGDLELNKNGWNFISYCSYRANFQNEDKYDINIFVTNDDKEGLFMSVLDGHGGSHASEFTNENFYDQFLSSLKIMSYFSMDNTSTIIYALKHAFHKIEERYYYFSLEMMIKDNMSYCKCGACVLITVIFDNILYTANLGDSKSRLFDIKFEKTKLMHRHNISKKREKDQLKRKFPNLKEAELYKCSDTNICYVRDELQCSRAIGDFSLKIDLFRKIKYDYLNYGENLFKQQLSFISTDNYQKILNKEKLLQVQYVESTPEIIVFDLKKLQKQKYLLITSDGFGDVFSSSEASEIFKSIDEIDKDLNFQVKSEHLLLEVIGNIMETHELTFDQLNSKKSRRNLMDDTTIILLEFDTNK